MRYNELQIVTRREIPARARTDGERNLIRAGYLDSGGRLTRFGDLAIARLYTAVSTERDKWAVLGDVLTT